MKTGYVPKDQRKKILLLSDDIRTHSGVGTQARQMVLNTAHHFNWVNLGGAINHPDAGKSFDISQDTNNIIGIQDADVKVIPNSGYGDPNIIRHILNQEKPDAIIHFTDPRYWIWLYQMENEIRQKIPMVFYTIWDDVPYPMYNREFYRSDDMHLCISRQTENIVKNVLKDHPKEDWAVKYVPHGINEKQFFPIINDFEFEAFKEDLLGKEEQDFVVLWNSRNIRRKNPSDIILAWRLFLDQLPDVKAKKCTLIMHTDPVDDNGTDLPRVVENFCDERHRVIFTGKNNSMSFITEVFNYTW